MRTGYMRLAAVFVDCPYCGEGLPAGENYSYLISDLRKAKPGDKVKCEGCYREYIVPKKIGKLA